MMMNCIPKRKKTRLAGIQVERSPSPDDYPQLCGRWSYRTDEEVVKESSAAATAVASVSELYTKASTTNKQLACLVSSLSLWTRGLLLWVGPSERERERERERDGAL
jgi:hypothetical protein